VDKNLYYNQKHLRNILQGTQNQYMENINDPRNMNNYPLEVLKRKEWARKNKEKADQMNNCQNRVDMIGSGNIYDASKIETMIARENYFNKKFNQTANPNLKNSGLRNQKEEQLSRQPSHSRKSHVESQSGQSHQSRQSYQSGYRDSVEQGWPPKNNMNLPPQETMNPPQRKSMNAKQHNDELFRKKSMQRKSLGYTNISGGNLFKSLIQ